MHKYKSVKLAVAMLLGTVIIIAGCGSSGSGSNSASSGSTPASGDLQTLTVAVGTSAAYVEWPLYVASEDGYFKKNGINVNFVELPPGATTTAALASGSVDLANLDLLNMAPLLVAGKQFTDVAQMTILADVLLAGGNAPAKSFGKALPMSAGTTVGAPSANGAVAGMLKYIQSQYGGDPNSIRVVSDAPGAGLLSGSESYWFGDPEAACLLQSKGATELFNPGDVAGGDTQYPKLSLFLGLPDEGLWGSNSWVDSHPAVIKAVQKSVDEAIAYLKSDPSKAAAALRKTRMNIPSFTSAQFANCVTSNVGALTTAFPAADASRYNTYLRELRIISTPLPPAKQWLAPGV